MSTAALHYGSNERRAVMLEKLGGKDVLRQAVDKFYNKQMGDERLMEFFEGVDVEIIKWHQFNLMSIAFTAVPESFDVKAMILGRHQRLFDEGLNESHFDMVAKHFSDTLKEMDVDSSLVEEALEVVMPLRDVFAQGAQEARERKKADMRLHRLAVAIVITVVAVGAMRLVKSKKR